MAIEWLATILPLVRDAKVSEILREKVTLLEMQRADAIDLLDKADSALANAKQEITNLKRENDELKKKAHSLQPTSDLAADAVKILKYFFDRDRPFTEGQIAMDFKLSPSVAKYHMDTLHDKKFIGFFNLGIRGAGQPMSFKIMSAGRAYIMEHCLSGESLE